MKKGSELTPCSPKITIGSRIDRISIPPHAADLRERVILLFYDFPADLNYPPPGSFLGFRKFIVQVLQAIP